MRKLDHLWLIDGSYFVYRFFHAMPRLARPDGTPVGAVYGFTRMIIQLLSKVEASHLAVIFDSQRCKSRLSIFPQYKLNRKAKIPDLACQWPLVYDVCHAFSIPYIKQDGCEADDLIATYTRAACLQGGHVTILSGDKDFMQLVCADVRIFDPFNEKYTGPNEVLGKWGVVPGRVCDVQALVGDRVDNIPGVPSIGLRTAARLINYYGTLQVLLSHCSADCETRVLKLLHTHKGTVELAYRLVKLNDHVEVHRPVWTLERSVVNQESMELFLREQNFTSLL